MSSAGPSWIVPIECVRASADLLGISMLANLAHRHAELRPHATVELGGNGFVATVHYQLPGYVERTEQVHVGLAWAPQENRL